MKKALLALLLLQSFCTAFAQKNYRVKTWNNTAFILPPHARIGREGWCSQRTAITYNSHFRYHRIAVTGLTGHSYTHFLDRIRDAAYEHDRKPISQAVLQYNYHTRGAAVKINTFTKVYFSDSNDGFVLELDYTALSRDPAADFNQLAVQLFGEFRKKETAAPQWPTSVCQDIVEKVFELLPVPAAASLAQLGFLQEKEFSLLLLSPRIKLLVDLTNYDDRSTDAAPDWKYSLAGQITIPLYKIQNSQHEVFFRQIPFLSRDYPKDKLANNLYKDSATHQASSVDIELSAETSAAPFLFLYLHFLKGNNNNASFNSSTTRKCCGSANDMLCSSLILFRDDLAELSAPKEYCKNDHTPVKYATFGERSPVQPVIPVYLDGNLTDRRLGLKISDLVDTKEVNLKYRLERADIHGYHTVKTNTTDIYLLPGDKITNL